MASPLHRAILIRGQLRDQDRSELDALVLGRDYEALIRSLHGVTSTTAAASEATATSETATATEATAITTTEATTAAEATAVASSETATAAEATAIATESTSTASGSGRRREVKSHSSAVKLNAVQSKSVLGRLSRLELHMGKALGAALFVKSDSHLGDLTILAEELSDGVLLSSEAEVANEESVGLTFTTTRGTSGLEALSLLEATSLGTWSTASWGTA